METNLPFFDRAWQICKGKFYEICKDLSSYSSLKSLTRISFWKSFKRHQLLFNSDFNPQTTTGSLGPLHATRRVGGLKPLTRVQ